MKLLAKIKNFLFPPPLRTVDSILNRWSDMTAVVREHYEGEAHTKPNDHCNWGLLFPTVGSPYGWVENDEHLRKRMVGELKTIGIDAEKRCAEEVRQEDIKAGITE
jgi:hypothetical protein